MLRVVGLTATYFKAGFVQCSRPNQSTAWRPDVSPDDQPMLSIPALTTESGGNCEPSSHSPVIPFSQTSHQNMIFEALMIRSTRTPLETSDLIVLNDATPLDELAIPNPLEVEVSPPFLSLSPDKKPVIVGKTDPVSADPGLPALPATLESLPLAVPTHSRPQRSVSPHPGLKPGSTTSHSKQVLEEAPLQALSEYLDNLFHTRRPKGKITLSGPETQILRSIIRRKYGSENNLMTQETSLSELLGKLQSTNSNKRPEENYKFIFKRCLKHMKEKFKTDNPAMAKRKDMDKQFYEHYFRQVSDSQKISIDNFYHPKNSKVKNKVGPKTINNTYIQNICKSKLFKTDFSQYLDHQLLGEYQESIKLKIKNLISRWSKDLKTSSNREEATRKICEYIEENKKCKLPWSVKEVGEAIKAVNQLFEQAHPKTT